MYSQSTRQNFTYFAPTLDNIGLKPLAKESTFLCGLQEFCRVLKCTVQAPNLRRSSPALEQRAAAIVTDFCKKNQFRFSQLRLSERAGDLRIEYNLHINGQMQGEEAGQRAKELERRLVFLLSESSGATVAVKWSLDWGYAKAERFHPRSSECPRSRRRVADGKSRVSRPQWQRTLIARTTKIRLARQALTR